MARENNGSMVAWFVGGAVLGAVVTLLLAPESGEKIRQRLAGQAESGGKSLLESGQEFISRGRELFERGREIAEDAAELFDKTRRLAEKKIDERI
jgi:gas vesicle protein